MNGYYGWTYAGRLHSVSGKRSRKTNRLQKEERRTKRLSWDKPELWRTWTLGQMGRLLVFISLLVLSIAVLGKDRTLRAEMLGWIDHCWQQAKTWIRNDTSQKGLGVQEKIAEKRESSLPAPASVTVNPMAVISDNGLFIMDAKGVIWPLPNEKLPGDFPVLTGMTVREEPGEMGVSLRAEVDLDFLKKMLAVPYSEQISEIHLGSHEGVILFTRDAIKVLLRKSRYLDRDLKRLGAVIADIRVKQKEIAVVDLRYNQHVVVRPKRRR
jgi:hypothetical protein